MVFLYIAPTIHLNNHINSKLYSMKVFVTGADGLLGNNVVRELLHRNYDVSVLLFKGNNHAVLPQDLPVKRFYGNILDKAFIQQCIAGHDMVIHAAASTQVFPARDPMINQINVDGTQNVIDACLMHQVKRLLHIGSATSFPAGDRENPGTETGNYNGYQFGLDYLDSKYRAQQIVLAAVQAKGLNAIVLNPTFMIGPYDGKPSSGAMIIALYRKKIPAYTNGAKTYIAVKDAAVAIANALTAGKIGECYLLGNFNYTHREAFAILAKAIGVRPPRFRLPHGVIYFIGIICSFIGKITGSCPEVTKEIAMLSCGYHCYSGEKARKELNMPCTDLSVAARECMDWFLANGYLN
jgi:dihydroflavonol-4-reductase